MDIAKLKENAKRKLTGKYGDAIIFLIIYMAINAGVSALGKTIFGVTNFGETSVSFYSGILEMIVGALFIFGYNSYFLKLSRDEKVDYKELFSKTNMFVPGLIITFVVGILTALGLVLLIVPGIIVGIMYSQAYFVALDNKELSPIDAMKRSRELMAGHKMDYFVLILSFLGWLILSVFTLGILLFYVIPYMNTTLALFYNSIKK